MPEEEAKDEKRAQGPGEIDTANAAGRNREGGEDAATGQAGKGIPGKQPGGGHPSEAGPTS